TTAIEDLSSFNTVASRAREQANAVFSGLNESSRQALIEIANLAQGLKNVGGSSTEAVNRIRELQQIDGLDEEVRRYIDTFDRLLIGDEQVIAKQRALRTSLELVETRKALADTIELLGDLAANSTPFANYDGASACQEDVDTPAQKIREGSIDA